MIEFKLNGQEYIELNKLLKLLQLTETGGEANAVITNKMVRVNNATETQKRKKLRAADKVIFQKQTIIILP